MMPPRSILTAVDFSEPSRVALEFAARLARQCQATLHVLHVENRLLTAAARAEGIDLTHETRKELTRFTTRAMTGNSTSPQLHIVTGDAWRVGDRKPPGHSCAAAPSGACGGAGPYGGHDASPAARQTSQ